MALFQRYLIGGGSKCCEPAEALGVVECDEFSSLYVLLTNIQDIIKFGVFSKCLY